MPSRKHIVLFFLINFFLCSWHLDSGHNDSTMSRAALVAAIVEHGTLRIDAYHAGLGDKALIDGHYYSDKAPLPSFVLVPFWWCATELGIVHAGANGLLTDRLLQLGGLLCGSLPLAIIITLLWLRLRRSRPKAVMSRALLASLPVVGSFLFVYSGSFYNHLPAALFMLLAAFAIEDERPMAAGGWAGAAILTDTMVVVIILAWGLQFLIFGRRSITRFLAGLLPSLVLLAVYNWAVTGSALVFPASHAANYAFMKSGYGFGWPRAEALWGLTFSAYRGLFFYMPVLVLLWFLLHRTRSARLLSDPFLFPAVALVIAYSMNQAWPGGWAYGPRYLTTAAIFLFAFFAPRMLDGKAVYRSAIALSTFGFLCAFMAKSTLWYSLPTGVQDPLVEEVMIRAFAGEWTTMQWPVELGLSPGMAVLLFPLMLVMGLFAMHRIDRSIAT